MPLNVPSPSQIDQGKEVHKLLGDRIKQLEMESLEPEPWEAAEALGGAASVSHLSAQRRSKFLNLIGKKCIMDCSFNGVPTQAV